MHPSVRLLAIDAADREKELMLVRPPIGIHSTHQCANDGVQLTNASSANLHFVHVNLEGSHSVRLPYRVGAGGQPAHAPLRTVRESFPSHGSSLVKNISM